MTEIKEDNVCQPGEPVAEDRFRRIWARLKRNKVALIGGILILIYVLSALLAPVLFPGNPSAPNLIDSLESPTLKDPLGTDELGRSILGRIIYGSRVSLTIAVGVVFVGIVFGIPLGLISGYYGGKIDFGIQTITDTMLAFPGFLLALALVSVLGVAIKNTVISYLMARICWTWTVKASAESSKKENSSSRRRTQPHESACWMYISHQMS
jgi:ABC-type dipeptide/oligopeptide/nickel transport system permease subunit